MSWIKNAPPFCVSGAVARSATAAGMDVEWDHGGHPMHTGSRHEPV